MSPLGLANQDTAQKAKINRRPTRRLHLDAHSQLRLFENTPDRTNVCDIPVSHVDVDCLDKELFDHQCSPSRLPKGRPPMTPSLAPFHRASINSPTSTSTITRDFTGWQLSFFPWALHRSHGETLHSLRQRKLSCQHVIGFANPPTSTTQQQQPTRVTSHCQPCCSTQHMLVTTLRSRAAQNTS